MNQSTALKILQTGANVFLTGEPGSGKTHTVNQYVQWLRERGIEPAITASTGIAATHIGGMTIHSWSGVGVRRRLDEYDIDFIASNERTVRRITNARILIVDEISMLSAQTLSMVDSVLRTIRRSSDAFGGLQVVLVGDFFQLPPIVAEREIASDSSVRLPFANAEHDPKRQYAFESPAWTKAKLVSCYLSEQYRHEDSDFLEILSALRGNRITPYHRARLMTRTMVTVSTVENVAATKLFSHNADVERINDAELARLPGAPRMFGMEAHGQKALIEQLKRGCLSPELLKLKTGARVMFTKNNFQEGFVNGTTGEVIGFRQSDGWPIVRTNDGDITAEPMSWIIESDRKPLAEITQVPVRLAWAITVHKSQGMSLDRATVDLRDAFEYGQGYVALSRLRTLAGLHLLGLNQRALEVHPAILKHDQTFREDSEQASRVFESLPDEQLEKMQKNFVSACGGTTVVNRKRESHANSHVPKNSVSSCDATKELLSQKKSLADIAKVRRLTIGTVVNHLEQLHRDGKLDPGRDLKHLIVGRDDTLTTIHKAIRALGPTPLRPVFDHLGGRVPYETIRLARLLYRD